MLKLPNSFLPTSLLISNIITDTDRAAFKMLLKITALRISQNSYKKPCFCFFFLFHSAKALLIKYVIKIFA